MFPKAGTNEPRIGGRSGRRDRKSQLVTRFGHAAVHITERSRKRNRHPVAAARHRDFERSAGRTQHMPFKPVASPNNLSRLLSASRRIDVQFSLPADDLPKFCILRKTAMII
jgi:hypothetical protein